MGGEGEPPLLSREEWLRRVMELEREAQPDMEWVMCSTCCGFVWRKKRSAMPNPDPGKVEEMLTDAKKMRAAMMPKPRLVDEEPDAATKILLMRRRMMMEHKRCPTCYRSVSDTPETKPCNEDKMGDETMAADAGSNKQNKRSKEEDGTKENKRSKNKRSKKNKKKRSKNKNKRSMEEPRGGEVSEGEAMLADLGSREDSDNYMGWTGMSSSESNDYSMGRTGKSSSENNDYSMGRTGKPRTKMVTSRLSKDFVQFFISTHPPSWPFTNSSSIYFQTMFARQFAEYEVECELQAYWQSQCDIKGYVEYQEEVTDDEDAS